MPIAPASINTPIFSMFGGNSLIIFCAFSGRILRLLRRKDKAQSVGAGFNRAERVFKRGSPADFDPGTHAIYFLGKLLWLLTGLCHANVEKPRWMANTILHPARAAAISARDLQRASALHQSGMPGSRRHAARGSPRRYRFHFPPRAARDWECCSARSITVSRLT